MKKYIDLISSKITESVNLREDIEWSNFWYDQANSESVKRICIIGDSTARMIRSTFAKEMGVACDLYATSAGLHDKLFIAQLETFFGGGVRSV